MRKIGFLILGSSFVLSFSFVQQVAGMGEECVVNKTSEVSSARMNEAAISSAVVSGAETALNVRPSTGTSADGLPQKRIVKVRQSLPVTPTKCKQVTLYRPVVYNKISVIVNPLNADTMISVANLKKILSGEVTRWNELGSKLMDAPIEIVIDASNSYCMDIVRDSICEGAEPAVEMKRCSSGADVSNYVKQTKNAVGILCGENDARSFTLPLPDDNDNATKQVPDKIYSFVEQMPVFPGGDAALLKYIATHLKYPASSMQNGTQGRCMLRFEVKTDGTIGEVQLLSHLDAACDREAVRVIKTVPKFQPGMQDGQAVNVWYQVPVIFQL